MICEVRLKLTMDLPYMERLDGYVTWIWAGHPDCIGVAPFLPIAVQDGAEPFAAEYVVPPETVPPVFVPPMIKVMVMLLFESPGAAAYIEAAVEAQGSVSPASAARKRPPLLTASESWSFW